MPTGSAADNYNVPGTLTCGQFFITGTTEIPTKNLKHVHRHIYSQEIDTTPSSEKRVMHVAVAAGTIIAFKAGVAVKETAGGTVTINLCKNDETTSVLTAAIVLNSSNTAWIVEVAAITTPAFVAGDVLVATIANASSTDAEGLFVMLDVTEAYD